MQALLPRTDPVYSSLALTHILNCKWKLYAKKYFIYEALIFLMFFIIMIGYSVYILPIRINKNFNKHDDFIHKMIYTNLKEISLAYFLKLFFL